MLPGIYPIFNNHTPIRPHLQRKLQTEHNNNNKIRAVRLQCNLSLHITKSICFLDSSQLLTGATTENMLQHVFPQY